MSNNNKTLAYSVLILLSFTWGSSFILMKLAMEPEAGKEAFTAMQVGGLRMVLAFLALSPFLFKYIPRIPRNKWLPIAVVGLCGNGIPSFLFTTAETHIEPSLAGMLNSTTPIFTILISSLIFRHKFSLLNFIGIFLGFAGTAGMMLANGSERFSGEFSYSLMVLLATLCYAVSVNTIRNYLTDVHPIAVTAGAFLIIAPPILLYLLLGTDLSTRLSENEAVVPALGWLGILSLFGTALAVILFNWLVKATNAVFASTVTYLIPITAIFWGLFNKESLAPLHLISIAVILGGVWMVNKR